MPTGQNTLSFDNNFNGNIPHKLHLFFLRQSAVNGSYTRNGAYFSHYKVSSVQLQLNGNNVTSLNAIFPKQVRSMFHHTLIKNGNIGQNLLSQKTFKDDRKIFVWDLRPSDSNDTIPMESSGNLRLKIQTSAPSTGVTNGLITVDSNKRVETSYLINMFTQNLFNLQYKTDTRHAESLVVL